MDNIIKKQGYNFGGVRDILFVPMDKVVSIPIPDDTGMVDSSSVVLDQDGWLKFAFTAETGYYKEEQSNVAGGVLYKLTVEMEAAKDSLNRFLTFYDMEFHRFLILVRDNNNISRLCGFIDKDGSKIGMRFSTEVTTKTNRTGFNATAGKFYLECYQKPRIAFNVLDLVLVVDPPHFPGDESEELLPPSE